MVRSKILKNNGHVLVMTWSICREEKLLALHHCVQPAFLGIGKENKLNFLGLKQEKNSVLSDLGMRSGPRVNYRKNS